MKLRSLLTHLAHVAQHQHAFGLGRSGCGGNDVEIARHAQGGRQAARQGALFLCYHHGGASLPADKPHAFVYYITIRNSSACTVTLLGRKWVVEQVDGERLVIEGDKIVGETPRLTPGEEFSYNSFHVTGVDAVVHGSFHGIDEAGLATASLFLQRIFAP